MSSDVRYAWRQLRRSPAFTVMATLTLALGIAANTAFFSVVNGTYLRVSDGLSLDRVTLLRAVDGLGRHDGLSARLEDLRVLEAALPPQIEAVAAIAEANATARSNGPGRSIAYARVSGGFAPTFGLRAQTGRWIGPNDDLDASPAQVAVISDRLWREWFGALPDALGKTIRISQKTYTVIGVTARSFRGLAPFSAAIDVWVPLAAPPFAGPPGARPYPGALTFIRWRQGPPPSALAHGLLEPVATGALRQREAQLREFAKRYRRPLNEQTLRATIDLVAADRVLGFTDWIRQGLIILAVASLVLVAACANFANLLHARGARRAGEVAVRLSLGASRWRVLRLFATEAALVAGLASLVGLGLAMVGADMFASAFPAIGVSRFRSLPLDAAMDWRVVLFALGSGAFATVTVGVTTAWRASRSSLLTMVAAAGAAPGHTPGRGRIFRTALVAVQVTVAVVLVITAGMFLEGLLKNLSDQGLLGRRVHFDAAHVVSAETNLPRDFNEPRGRQFFERLLTDAARLPGVDAAGLADAIPGALGAGRPGTGYLALAKTPGGLAGDQRRAGTSYVRVSAGFLRVLDLPLLAGRDIGPHDVYGAPMVAVLSKSAAEAAWPGQDPIGRQLQFDKDAITVVGIAADPVSARDTSPWERPANFVFLPFAQHYRSRAHIVIRSAAPEAQIDALAAVVRAIDEDVVIFQGGTVASSALAWMAPLRALVSLATGLGVAALAIAMLGVYSVLAFFVSTRTREIGIRAALGATPRQVRKMVMDEALRIVLIGLLCGSIVASVGSRLALALDSRVLPTGLTAWVAVPILILLAGIAAGFLPARRAARIDPNVALREL